ncbi:MAG: amidohydrolase [Bacillota bacterium]|nr:amidohydrolase [Bacillota bacterium]
MGEEEIAQAAEAMREELVAWRRHLHRHPELSFQEEETAGWVAERLRSFGLEPRRPWGTAVVADLDGGRGGRTVAIRADMDALPVEEATGLEFASERPGVMHACGHDGHTAILLGVARLLATTRARWPGRVRFLFQPAEEKIPGGALGLIEHGALDGVDAVVGLHLWSNLPVGKAGLNEGALMANADDFRIVVHGRGGHGSAPHQAVDALWVGAQIVTGLQGMMGRAVDPLQPAVLTVGTFHAGFNFNVIAPAAEMTGTVRTFDEVTREEVIRRMRALVEHLCAAAGASYDFEYNRGYPALTNHPQEARVLAEAARSVLGAENVDSRYPPNMGGEDFAYYLQRRPGAFLLLGAGPREGAGAPHHSPQFTIDEEALPLGVRILSGAALRLLEARD